ncbi:maleylpyruvate isomerase N-terminal domain-containing protein [Mycolicibacterium psychrotolerans]|uniref:Mycothiol-dependent maleylpyruvate isomerase metal-binding domain-containing protein n=1 Tax=Mycolicibacterium psychrotolerans TaxID=216929 RepID=A0A7I7M623_9MYCO|nr:maleylpyruvate isomerase N-terminal domain-containing protein [Mycolicibacterium psychrotolerans]BBX67460.1 hypothetical protein MPSYJ_09210 [Mycolicibacterium psychrotolerans]
MPHLTARGRVEALRSVRALAVQVIDSLTPQEWASASAAEGWTVHDVVAHMSSTQRELFGPLMFMVARSNDIEALNETPVKARRRWPDARVAAEYRRWAPRGHRLLKLTQLPGLGSVPVPMAELGRFPVRVLPSAIAFDTHTHLYHDIAPVLARPLPPPDPSVIAATLEWMMLVAAAMGSDLPLPEGTAVRFAFTGPGGSEWTLRRTKGTVIAEPDPGCVVAGTLAGAAADFPAWCTHRKSWRDVELRLSGEEDLVTAVVDGLRVV